MKNIGKPCAGKLHARFDEGGQARACSLLYPHFLGNQESISLSALKKLGPALCRFGEINKAVAELMNTENTAPQHTQDG
jgi:hypothetical protein